MIKVRVRNFQSIEDEEVVIDGLTVVTGPNNSGKTAFMRAVRGVFTNASPGPLIRHGAAYLSVAITFDDGAEVLWEKGWEKPGRKGKTVNRYVVNGVSIANVGRGVPPEVAALGVGEIKAASDRIWPQIARQFEGTLFLVNRPGSAVAEALSDVERVGKLTEALRLSEKDRRSSSSELKIRHSDLALAKDYVAKFEGLSELSSKVALLKEERKTLGDLSDKIEAEAQLLSRLKTAQADLAPLKDFSSFEAPDYDRVSKISTALGLVESLREKRESCMALASQFENFEVSLPVENLGDLGTSLESVRKLREQFSSGSDALVELDSAKAAALAQLSEVEDQVATLLGERGFCPTCNTVHERRR